MKLNRRILSFARNIGYYLLPFFIDVLCRTLKIELRNYEQIQKILNNNQKIVSAFWHGSMLIPWYINRRNNFSAIVSQSKDGELLARTLRKWGYKVARGSTSSGGKAALEQILQDAKNNYSVSLTPDGPQGPPNKMKAGAVVVSKKTGLPLVMIGSGYSNFYQFNSWDKFKIPKPFSRVKIIFADPVYISAGLNYDDTSAIINECEGKLNKLQAEAEVFN